MPQQKSDKLLPQLSSLCVPQSKLERRLVEKVVGLLVWFASGCPWMKPWLEPLYHILLVWFAFREQLGDRTKN